MKIKKLAKFAENSLKIQKTTSLHEFRDQIQLFRCLKREVKLNYERVFNFRKNKQLVFRMFLLLFLL